MHGKKDWRCVIRLCAGVGMVVLLLPGVAGSESARSGTAFAGRILDICSEAPVAGASISIENVSVSVTSSVQGEYRLLACPGTHEVRVGAPGYIPMSKSFQTAIQGSVTQLDFRLVPQNPTLHEADVIDARFMVHQHLPSQELGTPLSDMSAVPRPRSPAVSVPDTIRVLMPDTTVVTMDMDEYLKGVLPCEMSPSWPVEALKAQAVAARCFAATAHRHSEQGADVCTTDHCQVWSPEHYDTTDQAVTDTHAVVATYDGLIIQAYYFGHCDGRTRNSEDVWVEYLPYCRSVGCICGYGELYGHGVGMCQRGAQAMANDWADYREILCHYYTGIDVQGEAPPAQRFLTLPFDRDYDIIQGWRYNAPINPGDDPYKHEAIDYAAPEGTDILAAARGKAKSFYQPGDYAYGNYVVIDHENGCYTLYAHLEAVSSGIGSSAWTGVDAGQVIGESGMAGGGPHLHFELSRGGWGRGYRTDPYGIYSTAADYTVENMELADQQRDYWWMTLPPTHFGTPPVVYEVLWAYEIKAGTNCLSVSSDATYIVAGSPDGVRLLHGEGGLLWTYETDYPIVDVSITADAKRIVAAASLGYFGGGTAYFFQVSSGEPEGTFRQDNGISSASYSPEGDYLGMAYDHGLGWYDNVALWGYNEQEWLWYKTFGRSETAAAALSRDGEYVAVGGAAMGTDAGGVRVYNKSAELLWEHAIDTEALGGDKYSLGISSDGRYVAAGNRAKSRLYFFDRDQGDHLLWTYETGAGVRGVSISSDGNFVVAGNGNGVHLLDQHKNLLWSLQMSNVADVSMSSDAKTIVVGTANGMIYAFGPHSVTDAEKQERLLGMVNAHSGTIPTELVLAILRQEGGVGAFYVDSAAKSPDLYEEGFGPWSQPTRTNRDGVMQVSAEGNPGYHEKSGPYTHDAEGYDHAIHDGCDYLIELFNAYGTYVQAVLHYNSGPHTLYTYLGRQAGDRNYLSQVANHLMDFVPGIYGLRNEALGGELRDAQGVLDKYLYDMGIATGMARENYAAYQEQLDRELFYIGFRRLGTVAVEGEDAVAGCATQPGDFYQLQYCADLSTGEWTNVGEPVAGTGGRVSLFHPAGALAPSGFYRVYVLP